MTPFWKYCNRYSNVNLLSSRPKTVPTLLLLQLSLGQMLPSPRGSPFSVHPSSRILVEIVWLNAEVWALHTPYFRLIVLIRQRLPSLIHPCRGVYLSIPHHTNLEVRPLQFVFRRDTTPRSTIDTNRMIPPHDDNVRLAGHQPSLPCQYTPFTSFEVFC